MRKGTSYAKNTISEGEGLERAKRSGQHSDLVTEACQGILSKLVCDRTGDGRLINPVFVELVLSASAACENGLPIIFGLGALCPLA
jgi:hypothetical protein